MRICIYVDDFAFSATSANPQRGMVKNLLALRPQDHFVLVARSGAEAMPRFHDFLSSLPGQNWTVKIEHGRRRIRSVLCLLGWGNYSAIRESADIYLNMDLDSLGDKARPLIATVADISAIREPKHSSLKWHGVRMRRHGLKVMARRADRIVAISGFTCSDLSSYLPATTSKLSVIPNGIDDIWFAQPSENYMDLEQTSLLTSPYWIWYGQMTRRKNIHGLLEGYRLLSRRYNGKANFPKLLLVGPVGHGCADIPSRIAYYGLSDRVLRVDFQSLEKLVGLVSKSSGLIFPSFYEGFGLPIIEAMAQGRPVVTSNVTAMPEVAGGLAFLCSPDNFQSIAEAMEELMNSDCDLPEAKLQRRRWAARFTHSECAHRYDNIITSVMREAAPTRERVRP